MIKITPDHFTGRDEALARIRESGLYPVELKITQEELTGVAHVHPYDVDIYMLEGMLELDQPEVGVRHVLTVGDKGFVPSTALHAEVCPAGFRAVFGLSLDPATLDAARTAPAETSPAG